MECGNVQLSATKLVAQGQQQKRQQLKAQLSVMCAMCVS
jgi:hypothetical protein